MFHYRATLLFSDPASHFRNVGAGWSRAARYGNISSFDPKQQKKNPVWRRSNARRFGTGSREGINGEPVVWRHVDGSGNRPVRKLIALAAPRDLIRARQKTPAAPGENRSRLATRGVRRFDSLTDTSYSKSALHFSRILGWNLTTNWSTVHLGRGVRTFKGYERY